MSSPSPYLPWIQSTQSLLALYEIYVTTGSVRGQCSIACWSSHWYLLYITTTLSLLTLASSLFSLIRSQCSRSRRMDHNADTYGRRPRWSRLRKSYHKGMFALWLSAAAVMVTFLPIPAAEISGIAHLEVLLFAASACIVEGELDRVMLLPKGGSREWTEKGRSVSAGDVVLPSEV